MFLSTAEECLCRCIFANKSSQNCKHVAQSVLLLRCQSLRRLLREPSRQRHAVLRRSPTTERLRSGWCFGEHRPCCHATLQVGSLAIGLEALRSGMQFESDVLEGQNVKQAAVRRAKQAGSNLLKRAIAPPPGLPFFPTPPNKRPKRGRRRRHCKEKETKTNER